MLSLVCVLGWAVVVCKEVSCSLVPRIGVAAFLGLFWLSFLLFHPHFRQSSHTPSGESEYAKNMYLYPNVPYVGDGEK